MGEITKEVVRANMLVVIELARATIDAVADVHPEPAIEGPMYLAFMTSGMSLQTFQQLMARLVEIDMLWYIGNNQFVLSPQEVKRRKLVEHLRQYKKQEYSHGL